MEFTILGRTRLYVDGQLIDLGAAKQRALLTLLLIHVGKPVSAETVVDQLWPGRTRDEVGQNLYVQVSRLRGTLKKAGLPGAIPHEVGSYQLNVDPLSIDYVRFRRGVDHGEASARSGDHLRARELLSRALGMWKGKPLIDLRTDWAETRSAQMETSDYVPACQALIDSELALDEYASALRRLVGLMDEHRLDEIFARQRMLALGGVGRIADATNFYIQFRQRLRSEHGAEPGEALRDTYSDLLRRHAAARPSVMVGGGDPPAARVRSGSPSLLGRNVDLVGRDAVLEKLDSLLLVPGSTGRPSTVVLHGMPGVGKTAVALTWGRRRKEYFPDGQVYIDLNGFGYNPPLTADEAMAQLLGQLGVAPDQIPATDGERRLKVSHMLGGCKVLVVLDNVAGSKHAGMVLNAVGRSCAVLMTSRIRLDGLVLRNGATGLPLSTLSLLDSAELLRIMIGDARVGGDVDGLRALARLSGGLPLALMVIGRQVAVRSGSDLGSLARELGAHDSLIASTGYGGSQTVSLPRIFSWSVDALAPDERKLFLLLGLHPGPSFGSGVAGALAGLGHDMTQECLAKLAAAHLLEEQGFRRFRFHGLLRGYAVRRGIQDESADQRGAALLRMVDWYLRSAENARRQLVGSRFPVPPAAIATDAEPQVFDSDEVALRWCELERTNLLSATRLAAENGLLEFAWRIPANIAEMVERSGFKDDFVDVVPAALNSARALKAHDGEAGMLLILGRAHFGRHDYRKALGYFLPARSISELLSDERMLAVSNHNVACAYLELGEIGRAREIFLPNLQLHRKLRDRYGEAFTLHRLADTLRRLGEYDSAMERYHEALSIRQDIGHVRGEGDTLNALGELHYERGEHDLAIGYFRSALEVHDRSHDRVKAVEALTLLADAYLDSGSPDSSIDCAHQAVELCALTEDAVALARALTVLGAGLDAVADRHGAERAWSQALGFVGDADSPDAEAVRVRLVALGAVPGTVPLPRSDGDDDASRDVTSMVPRM